MDGADSKITRFQLRIIISCEAVSSDPPALLAAVNVILVESKALILFTLRTPSFHVICELRPDTEMDASSGTAVGLYSQVLSSSISHTTSPVP